MRLVGIPTSFTATPIAAAFTAGISLSRLPGLGSTFARRFIGVPLGIGPISRTPFFDRGFRASGRKGSGMRMKLSRVVVQMDPLTWRRPGLKSFQMASTKTRWQPATDGSPVKTPTALLCRKGADDHIEIREGGR